jgi:hypothetical protein
MCSRRVVTVASPMINALAPARLVAPAASRRSTSRSRATPSTAAVPRRNADANSTGCPGSGTSRTTFAAVIMITVATTPAR